MPINRPVFWACVYFLLGPSELYKFLNLPSSRGFYIGSTLRPAVVVKLRHPTVYRRPEAQTGPKRQLACLWIICLQKLSKPGKTVQFYSELLVRPSLW